MNAIQVRSGRLEPWKQGVAEPIFGGQEDDVAFHSRRLIGHGSATADSGGQIHEQQRLGLTWIAVQKRELAQGHPARPEPLQGARLDFAHADDSWSSDIERVAPMSFQCGFGR
jgi:hypothetical protein